MDIERKVLIAQARMSGVKDKKGRWKMTSIKKLAKMFECGEHAVREALEEVFGNGLVSVQRVDRKPDLELELLRRNPKLVDAVVIPSIGEDDATSRENPLADPRYQSLGSAMARYLCTGQVFPDGAVIGVGSGRAVRLTTKSRNPLKIRARNVMLVSLTGSVASEQKGTWFDAYENIINFQKQFAFACESNAVPCALTLDDDDQVAQARSASWLGRNHNKLTHALLGVGIVADGHRFHIEAKAGNEGETNLRSIHELLVELVDYCERVTANCPGYYPVAETSNHLLCVPSEWRHDLLRRQEQA